MPLLAGHDSERLVRESVLFRGCTPDDLTELTSICELQRFAAGQDIIREGDDPRYVYVVQEGEVAALKGGSASTGPHEMGRMGVGDHFGELALLDTGARSATVRALTPVAVLAFPITRVMALAEERPQFARVVIGMAREVAARFRQANAARVDALDRALQEERTRAAMGRFVLAMIVAYALYTFLFGLASVIKATLGRTEFFSVPVLALMAGIQVQFMRRSGYPPRFFGLTLKDGRRHALEAVVFTLPLLALVIALKVALVTLVPAMNGAPVFRMFARPSGFRPLLLLAYAVFIPFQELIIRGSMQGALEHFLIGEGRSWNAILASNAIFAAGHIHVSAGLAASVFVTGLFWGWLYSRQRSLVGVSVSHLLLGVVALEVVGFPMLA